MENPEEVLQALDEFQKLRPSEIPRELEDYLCWVAKTGDPVYQWGLVKALFREKLQRVITDFYESCPSLDLTPCPNVEPFNYDAMRRTLVERLENFANAPFTVQRICELLTTPRKEYNRVDKFMRAIEKNILVVSTREPGANGRRSENGDNLVNGSLEDEGSHPPSGGNEVDMENWVKDCSTGVPAHHADEAEANAVENGLKERLEPPAQQQIPVAADATASSFVVSSSSDFSPVTVAPQAPSQQENSAATIQNLSGANNHEQTASTAAVVHGDVADAIMNEDTSSQPSLELESDESDSNDSKKLQTTFQHSDFPEDKSPKEYCEAVAAREAAECEAAAAREAAECEAVAAREAAEEYCEAVAAREAAEEKEFNEKESKPHIESTYDSEADGAEGDLNSMYKVESEEAEAAVSEEAEAAVSEEAEKVLLTEAQTSETSEVEPTAPVESFAPVEEGSSVKSDNEDSCGADSSEALSKEKCDTPEEKEDSKVESPKEIIPSVTESIESSTSQPVEQSAVEPVAELTKPIVEEPLVETTDPGVTAAAKPADSAELMIEETTEEGVKPSTKSIVPDPIPIVEEPKEVAVESSSIAEEVKDDSEAAAKDVPVEDESSKMVVTEEVKAAAESMEVDSGEQQQDEEPMEQESTTTTTTSSEAMSS